MTTTEETFETEPDAQTPPVPKTRKKRTPTPRAPRTIDPEIARIKAETAEKVAEYRKSLKSGGVLKTIVERLLPKLTINDHNKLMDYGKIVPTASLRVEASK